MLNRWPAVDGTGPVTAASSTTAIKTTRTAGGLAHIQLRRDRRGRARAPRGTRTPRYGGGGAGRATRQRARRRPNGEQAAAVAPPPQHARLAHQRQAAPPRAPPGHGGVTPTGARAGPAPPRLRSAPPVDPPPDPWRSGWRCPVQSPPPVGHQIAGGAGGADSASDSAGPHHGVAQPLRAFAGAHPLVATAVGEPPPPPQSRWSNSGALPVEHHPSRCAAAGTSACRPPAATPSLSPTAAAV